MKPSLSLVLFGLIFLIIGGTMIGGGVLYRQSSKEFFKTAESTTATIERIESYRRRVGSGANKRYQTEHNVYIFYEAEGQSFYDVELNYYSNTMSEGDNITIYFEPGNPTNIRVKFGESLIFILLSVIGGLFALTGFGIIILGFVVNSKKNPNKV